MAWSAWLVGIAVAVLLLVLWAIFQFNRMTTLRLRCQEAWANVDTELLRRHDLIPNLVETVKGFAKHERGLFEEVARARTAALKAEPTAAARSGREQALVAATQRLLAVAEAYPKLKASEHFLQLQNELAVTEDRIQAARRFYNGNVRDYANQIRQFPGSLVASLFSFRAEAYFEVEGLHLRAPSKVGFGG